MKSEYAAVSTASVDSTSAAASSADSEEVQLVDKGQDGDGDIAMVMEEGQGDVQSRTTLRLDGMCCASEVPIVHRVLNTLPGIENVNVDVLSKTATIVHISRLSSPTALMDSLNQASLKASIISCVLASSDNSEAMKAAVAAAKQHDIDNMYPKWNVLCGALCWALSLLHYIKDPAEMNNFKYVGLGSVAFCIMPILKRAYTSLKFWVMDINMLMTIAVAGACAMEDYSEAAAVVVLFAMSDWLSTRASARAKDAIVALIALRPDTAVMANDGTVIAVELVQIGDIVAVKSGDKIPVDGTIVTGTSSVDQANLTGESVPVKKGPDDHVSAGTINVGGGFLTIRSTALSANSAMSRLVTLVQQAQAETSPTEQLVMKIAKVYTPCVVLVALLMATIPWAWGHEIGMEYFRIALVSLIIACPCALVISTPIAYVCGLAHAARVGILVKGGQHLENLGHITCLALDKTGTLTTGRFELQHLNVLSKKHTRDQVLSLLLAVESKASHPMSAAICTSARAEGAIDIAGLQIENFENLKGEGVKGDIVETGKVISIGNRRLLDRLITADSTITKDSSGLSIAQPDSAVAVVASQWEVIEGGTVGYILQDRQLLAMFSVSDSARPQAKEAIDMLHDLGIVTIMLTGDNKGSALAIQRITGVQQVHSSLLPEDKITQLKVLRSTPELKAKDCYGRTRDSASTQDENAWIGMVGDGVNDAPALALATVGIAMGATGTVAAMETADVTLMDTDLRKLSKAISLGRLTVNKIRQNIIFSIVTKIVVFIIALAGYPLLWLAIAADVGAMIAVTLNSMELLGKGRPLLLEEAEKLTQKKENDTGTASDTCISVAATGAVAGVGKQGGEDTACQTGCCESGDDKMVKTQIKIESTTAIAAKPLKADCEKGCCAPKDKVNDKECKDKSCCSSDPVPAAANEGRGGCCASKKEEAPTKVEKDNAIFPCTRFTVANNNACGTSVSTLPLLDTVLSDKICTNTLVMFTAKWSKPCKAVSSYYEELSNSEFYAKYVHFVTMDVEEAVEDEGEGVENVDVQEKYHVVDLPTFVVFRNGVEHSRLAASKDESANILKDKLKTFVGVAFAFA